MSYLFPASLLLNSFSMTVLLIGLSLAGRSELAADVGIVQGITIALFHAFSANARNLTLNHSVPVAMRNLLLARLILLIPLSVLSWYLSVYLAHVTWSLAFALVLRRGVEWLGELHLSEMEVGGDRKGASLYIVLQLLLLLPLLGWIFSGRAPSVWALFLWGLLPLVMSLGFLRHHLREKGQLEAAGFQMLPHFGSSAVIGVSVYVFRLLLLLVVGKALAGDLFAAFAIGSALGSIFAMVLGPSLLLHEQKSGQERMPAWFLLVLNLTVFAGLTITVLVSFVSDIAVFAGKDMLFWQSLGYSLMGGVVMVFAQRQRLRDLQQGSDNDVFAPDVLANILIVSAIPFIFFIFGVEGLSWLYLFNAVVTLVFYWMGDARRTATGLVACLHGNVLKAVLAVLLVAPIFVNLETGLFRSKALLYDSGGVLSKLPIPLSAFGCYAGIAILGNYRKANPGLAMIFGSFVLMVISTVAMTHSNPSEGQAKFILLMQFILPMFGLVLGMMYEDGRLHEHLVEKTMLTVIAMVIPIQLFASWFQSRLFLTSDLYVFSIYQHLQYVPVIIVSSFLVALFSLWKYKIWRTLILLLAPFLGVYASASGSMLAGGFALAGCLAFAVHRITIDKNPVRWVSSSIVFLLVVGAGVAYQFWSMWGAKFIGVAGEAGSGELGMYTQKYDGATILNLQSRVHTWLHYLRGIGSDASTFFLGHNVPPDRKIWPSAHNYYLDFVYNFGFIAALVMIGFLIFTLIQLYRYRAHILLSPGLIGLTIVVLFLLIPDSLLKVGMRQPYPGILTFFLWGVLLARLESVRTEEKSYLSTAQVGIKV